jgi:carbon-monoxide dehydrogenase large subunit
MTSPPPSDIARIGTSRPRREDERLVTGRGQFIDDLAPPDALYIAFLRADRGPARIQALDVAPALALPGVSAAFTHAELVGVGELGVNPMLPGGTVPPQPLLPQDRVKAPGQLIAAIIAETALVARDGVEAIALRLDGIAPLPPDDPARVVLDHAIENGDVASAFAQAHAIATAEIRHPTLAPLAMEPRCALAVPDAVSGRLTLYLNVQTPHRAKAEMAGVLGVHPDNLRVVAPDIGGAFGAKASLAPEDVLTALAAMRIKRPVRWTSTRSDEFLSSPMGRGATMRGEIALDSEGTVLALRSTGDFPLGAWLPFSAFAPARNGLRMVSGPYRFTTLSTRVTCRKQDIAPVSIYRGAGRPEAVMLMERLMDEAAHVLGMNRLALRRRNLIPRRAFPFRMGTGVSVDSADGEGLIRKLGETVDLADVARRIARRRKRGDICGNGFALYVEPCGQGFESARLNLLEDGRLHLITGAAAQGQGRETTFAEIAGDLLGVSPDRIAVSAGDTDAIPTGMGALASRSTAIGGSAVLRAAEKLMADARRIAGNADPIDWAAIAKETGGLTADAVFKTDDEAWASGLAYAEVGLARETGELAVERLVLVDDAGTIINPLLAQGQLLGGIAQGFGEVAMERMAWSAEGQLLTGSLMDYAVPRATDVPPVTLASIVTRSPLNPLGAKGVGESGSIGTPAAILNAAIDALRPFGIKNLDMPLTSERLYRIIRAGTEP